MNGRGCIECGAPIGDSSMRCRSCAASQSNRYRQRLAVTGPGYCRRCGGPALLTSASTRCEGGCPPPHDSQRNPRYCELDGLVMGGHPRCRGCTALVGSRHCQQMAEGGYCEACVASLRRAREMDAQLASGRNWA